VKGARAPPLPLSFFFHVLFPSLQISFSGIAPVGNDAESPPSLFSPPVRSAASHFLVANEENGSAKAVFSFFFFSLLRLGGRPFFFQVAHIPLAPPFFFFFPPPLSHTQNVVVGRRRSYGFFFSSLFSLFLLEDSPPFSRRIRRAYLFSSFPFADKRRRSF